MELKGKKIAFLGDSITEGFGISHTEDRFAEIISQKTGCASLNYGLCGSRIAYQADEMPYHPNFCVRADSLDPGADIVVIFGGANDFLSGTAPIGAFSDRTYDTFYGALHVLMSKIVGNFSGKPILVITPLHLTNENDPCGWSSDGIVYGTLKTYVGVIREVAEYYSLPVLDLFAESGLQPSVDAISKRYFLPDRIHPNEEGNKILAEKIMARLLIM